MNHFISVLNRILKDRLLLRRWRRTVTILASVVVFVTTYMLILPAISVEKENVESVSGIYLEDAAVIDQNQYNDPASYEVITDAPLVQMQKAHAENHAESADKHQLYAYGDAYKIVVTYDDKSGIPDSAHLEVQEITQDPEAYASREISEYDEYVDNTVNALGWENGRISYARVFDICIMDELGQELQPAEGTTIDVRIELSDAAIDGDLNVVHFSDITDEGNVVENSVEGQTVEFAADGFSVYVIINHEGEDTVVNPRVEFHFIGEDFTGDGTYTASPYNFVNTAGDYQYTQILKNGESLELITNPPNIVIDNGDGTTGEKFFYGWYVVNSSLDNDTSVLNNTSGKYEGSITYTWPYSDHGKISFEDAIAINVPANATIGDTLTWTIGDVSGSGVLDEEGRVHVYLAPLYEDFYFVNFRMGPKEDASGLSNSLLTRKMIVFGSGDTATVRIGDVVCPSSDPQHKIFVGWETVTESDGSLIRKEYYQTVDFEGNEIDSEGSNDGYYIDVDKDDSTLTQVDLYPVFAEARWMKFNTGKSGNGAKYIGSAYRVTNDEGVGNYFDSSFFVGTGNNDSHLSSRAGYDFEGWYAFANLDSDGNITNLTEPQDVTINYIDETGTMQTVTVNTTAEKIVNSDGSLAYDGPYELDLGNGNKVKLFEVIDGKMYLYKAMDDITLYAHWTEKLASYRVIVWKQKVTDDVNATDAEKEYDYEIFYTSVPVDTGIEPDLTHFSGTYVDSNGVAHQVNNINLQNLTSNTQSYLSDFNGFHYNRNDVSVVGKPEPDGTTVYNVYYDRNVHTLTFRTGSGRNSNGNSNVSNGYAYTQTTSNTGTQYAFLPGENGGQVIQLTRNGNNWMIPTYGYDYVPNDNGSFVKVGDTYVPLEPIIGTTTEYVFKLTTSLTAGNDYLIVNSNTAGSSYYALGHNGASASYDSVTVNAATTNINSVWINVDDAANTSVWKAASSGNYWTFANNGYYLIGGNTNISFSTNGSTNTWQWNGTQLRNGNNGGYLRYRYGDFVLRSSNTSGNPIYLYELTPITTSTVVGYKYDNNGTETVYTNEQLYSYDYVQVGSKPYTGDRYTRTGPTNNAHLVFEIKALYDQNISKYFPIPGYAAGEFGNGERWYPQNDSVWNQVLAYIDTMPDRDVVFYLDKSTNSTKHLNYYVEALPGVTPEVTYNGTGFVKYTTVNADYGYFTEAEDYIDIPGFYKSNTYPPVAYNSSGNRVTNVWSNSNATDIYCYYLRESSDLTFDVNYPVDANLTYSNGKSQNLTVADIYYQYPLNEYGSTTAGGKTNWYYGVVDNNNTAENELVGPDHYIFGGWYEDASCTVPFNFGSTMPVGNKIVYAKWTPERFMVQIDPNGGEIDHVNHTYTSNYGGYEGYSVFNRPAIEGERAADYGYNRDQSTYINANYGTVISEYTIPRNYVPISETAAANYDGKIYYYINAQYRGTDGSGLPSDCRNAIYVTEDEIEQYYNFYRDWTQGNIEGGYITGTTVLDFDTWKSLYVSQQKYRVLNESENWTFLGWFKVVDGIMDSMPYNFTDPVTGPFTLKAMWRLDGGYKIEYVPEYTMPDGAIINGQMDEWNDPPTDDLTYADGASTEIYKQPTGLSMNGASVEDDSVIFLGWQLVNKAGTDENPVYIPVEPGTYYNPDDPYIVRAADADTESKIYFQAVYQYKDSSDRRPVVKNLTLDANSGYVNTSDSSDLPEWKYYPGTSAINTEDHLTTVDGTTYPTQIEFGDIQSSAAVHLYKYATELTENAAGTALTDAHQFFEHPDGFFLLGFDDEPTEGDFIATYPADSVIAITRDENRTIYAVWEPMVYLTLKNETGVGDVTFNLSSSSTEALEVINIKDGIYDRQPLSSLNNITIEDGKSITLAFPRGAEKDITISGTNTLGVGNVLIWNSSVELAENDTTYDTAITGQDVTYSHNGNSLDTHTLVTGEANNTKPFAFVETLIQNANAVTVTFTSRDNAYALVLDDNYPGGGIQEYDYSLDEISPENGVPKSQELPSTSTRIGYEFQGWAYEPDAETPDYSATSPTGSPWTISDLNATDGFFSEGVTEEDGTRVRTLYAIWKAKADTQVVYVYKDVPTPGNQNEEFDFNVAISGTYHTGSNTYTVSANQTFNLKHGWYLKITSANDNATITGHTTAYVFSIVQVYNSDGVQQGTDRLVRWERTGIDTTKQNGFNSDLRITVTEAEKTNYDTSVTRNAQTEANKLYLGNSEDIDTLPLTVETNRTYWTNTDAGGTVVYTNTRQTYDIAVKKILHSNTSASSIFSYNASYTLDDGDEPVDLGSFTVHSGSVNNEALKNIPAGAVLTITEVVDSNDNYITTVSSEQNAADLDEEARSFKFVVTGEDTITYDNTLKSYPVKFRLVDQDGNTSINGMFSLASTAGSLGTDLYASAISTNPPAGQFYSSDTFWADTYTLTQTVIPTNYIGPNGPVTLTVTGNGIVSSDPANVTVEEDGHGGYLITVINRATRKVTVKKLLSDPLLASTRQFGFSYNYMPEGSAEAVTGDFVLAPISNEANGVTYELTVPINASVTVAEKTTGDYASVETSYSTTVTSDVFSDSDSLDGLAFTVDRVEEDGSIIFTNTRKTSTVTVRKIFDPEEDSVSVTFAATVLNGATAIPGYTVYGTAGDAGALTTDSTGTVTFNLEHTGTQSLTVPYGARLVISEDIEGYTAEISTVNGASDLDNSENSFTMNVAGDDTVTFTNRVNGVNVILKKIGVSSETQEVVSDHLGGAEFTIYIDSDRTTVATGKIDLDGTTISIQLKNLISSDDDGIFFAGTLDIGTYYLHEVKAPAGYISPAEDLRMTVASDGSIVLYAQTSNTSNEFSVVDGVCSVNVKNSRGFALPSTGGRGRSHFYILGIMLIGMAGAAFFIRRKCRIATSS